jgi:hypothetical protein
MDALCCAKNCNMVYGLAEAVLVKVIEAARDLAEFAA